MHSRKATEALKVINPANDCDLKSVGKAGSAKPHLGKLAQHGGELGEPVERQHHHHQVPESRELGRQRLQQVGMRDQGLQPTAGFRVRSLSVLHQETGSPCINWQLRPRKDRIP